MDKLIANRDYELLCGNDIAFEFPFEYINSQSDNVVPKIAIISDREVSGYYYNQFEKQFIEHDIKPVFVNIESQNKDKSLKSVDELIKYINDFNFGADDWFIALGGGGVIDVVGFAHTILSSKVNFMVIPTTLNAMVESSVATNVYLNSMGAKDRLVTSFNPDIVVVDPAFLDTVPAKIKSNGYATVLKIALINDTSLISDIISDISMREFLNKCYKVRDAIEKENDYMLFLGEELKYAIEAYFRFLNYTEGEALALSLLSLVDEKRYEQLLKVYNKLGLPIKLESVNKDILLKLLRENYVARGIIETKIVDIENNRWVVKKLSVDDACDVFDKRIERICEKRENRSDE